MASISNTRKLELTAFRLPSGVLIYSRLSGGPSLKSASMFLSRISVPHTDCENEDNNMPKTASVSGFSAEDMIAKVMSR